MHEYINMYAQEVCIQIVPLCIIENAYINGNKFYVEQENLNKTFVFTMP